MTSPSEGRHLRTSPAPSGVGLIDGSIELWRRVLAEGRHDSGRKTFTAFELRWTLVPPTPA